jgi:hypothetical protein
MRSTCIILILALVCAIRAQADSVTLNSGDIIKGTIKSETPTQVTIEIPLSASITDERIIDRADIKKIDKVQPDEIEYRQLILVQPSNELSYSSQAYSDILASLNAFQAKYPNSSYLPEVKKLAAAFREEKMRVDAGEFKYRGEWLTRDEAARRAIQIMAIQVFSRMQQQAAAGDLVGAMQTFDIIDHRYATTRIYPSAVTLAQQVLANLQQDLAIRLEQAKADQAQLKKTIAMTPEPDKTRLIAAAKAQDERAKAAVESTLKSGEKWVPLIPLNELSITTLKNTATTEAQRLASVPVAQMLESDKLVDDARNYITGLDFKTADTLLKNATGLWSQNEAAKYWAGVLKQKTATPTPKPAAKPTVKPTGSSLLGRPDSAAAGAASGSEAAKPYYMTIHGAATIAAIVIVIGGLVAAYNQKKNHQASAQ